MNPTRNLVLIITTITLLCTARITHSQPSRIAHYYALINKAELAIVDMDFNKAVSTYQSAFALKNPNGKDLYNAFLAAYYCKDTPLAKQYFSELSFKGLERGVFKDTIVDYNFYQHISATHDSCYYTGAQSAMAFRGSILRNIVADYRKARVIGRGDPYYFNDSAHARALLEADAINTAHLRAYISEFGFPGFDKVGFWDGSSPNGICAFWWILSSCKDDNCPLDDIALKAVAKGDFRPDDWAAAIANRKNQATDYHMKIWQDTVALQEQEIIQINKHRSSINLENYNDYKKKWLFAQKRMEFSQTTYNPNLYKENSNTLYQFYFYNPFLVHMNNATQHHRRN